jgi:hypothetical protein
LPRTTSLSEKIRDYIRNENLKPELRERQEQITVLGLNKEMDQLKHLIN